MFLTNEELADLTGYQQVAKQAEQLKRQRIPFHTNAAGRPKVARAILEGRRVVSTTEKSWDPSWAVSPR